MNLRNAATGVFLAVLGIAICGSAAATTSRATIPDLPWYTISGFCCGIDGGLPNLRTVPTSIGTTRAIALAAMFRAGLERADKDGIAYVACVHEEFSHNGPECPERVESLPWKQLHASDIAWGLYVGPWQTVPGRPTVRVQYLIYKSPNFFPSIAAKITYGMRQRRALATWVSESTPGVNSDETVLPTPAPTEGPCSIAWRHGSGALGRMSRGGDSIASEPRIYQLVAPYIAQAKSLLAAAPAGTKARPDYATAVAAVSQAESDVDRLVGTAFVAAVHRIKMCPPDSEADRGGYTNAMLYSAKAFLDPTHHDANPAADPLRLDAYNSVVTADEAIKRLYKLTSP